jgi:phage shock protein C
MRKLYRSAHDKKIFGLCGGLGEYLSVDSTLLRVVVVVTTFFSGGVVIPLYILASIVIPKEPTFEPPFYGGGPYRSHSANASQRVHVNPEPAASNLDDMMKDIEQKAMKKEIEELRAKLAKYEKGE